MKNQRGYLYLAEAFIVILIIGLLGAVLYDANNQCKLHPERCYRIGEKMRAKRLAARSIAEQKAVDQALREAEINHHDYAPDSDLIPETEK